MTTSVSIGIQADKNSQNEVRMLGEISKPVSGEYHSLVTLQLP
jgi:hypothetical protein